MPEWISDYAGLIAKGLQITLSLLAISAVLGFVLAVLVALARLSRRKWLARGRWPTPVCCGARRC